MVPEIRTAWWPHTTNRQIASYRLRCLAILEELARKDVQVTLYELGKPPPDCLILSKRYDAGSLAHAADLRERHGTKVVLDLCDNHFYNPQHLPDWEVRGLELRAAIATSDAVIASTEALADVVRTECPVAPHIYVIGDAAELPDIPRLRLSHRRVAAELRLGHLKREISRASPMTRFVWFGNHGSPYADGGMSDLNRLREPFEQFARTRPLSLTVISNNRSKFRSITRSWSFPTYYLPWHEATISRALALHDIAVIPVTPNPFTLCKTNNRVATAFLHGLAVVADRIPSYEPFEHSAILDDWQHGLAILANDTQARADRVALGKKVCEQWTLPTIAKHWKGVIEAVVCARNLPSESELGMGKLVRR